MNAKYIKYIQYTGGLNKHSYLYDLPIVRYLFKNNISFDNDITFLIGENGTGKSTLIEAIAICAGFNAEGGSKNFNFSTRDTTSDLFKHIRIAKTAFPKDGFFLRSESFYNVASNIDDIEVAHSYGTISLHEQSHGESFFALFQNRFRGNGLYILDEPEAALSPTKQMSLLVRINELIKQNSQFIIATHSPILLSFPNSTILELTNSGLKKTIYNECEIYKLYKQFLDHPQQMLKYLLEMDSES